ncbi:MAG: ATP-binding cassette domain-containing protein [Armatimonadetes bacterium]|nr:ATP-binding cassette domain-containing protein [Armatimonadota bacterium]
MRDLDDIAQASARARGLTFVDSASATVQDLVLAPGWVPWSWKLPSGSLVGIYGQASSGRSRLLEVLLGMRRGAKGSVKLSGPSVLAGPPTTIRNMTPQAYAVQIAGNHRKEQIAEALSLTGLWDCRRTVVGNLPSGHAAAVEMLPVLLSASPIKGLDLQLDRVDPWHLPRIMEQMKSLCESGQTFLAVTNRPELGLLCDHLIVLAGHRVAFAGTVDDLLDSVGPQELHIETSDNAFVSNIVKPFVLEIDETPYGLKITTHMGQELSARLITEGYGKVEAIHHRKPSLQDAITSIAHRRPSLGLDLSGTDGIIAAGGKSV